MASRSEPEKPLDVEGKVGKGGNGNEREEEEELQVATIIPGTALHWDRFVLMEREGDEGRLEMRMRRRSIIDDANNELSAIIRVWCRQLHPSVND